MKGRMSMTEEKNYPPYLDYPKPREPQTNGDRIRTMSDDELAKWIDKMYCKSPWCDVKNPNCDDMECVDCLKKWLKQPPMEEHDYKKRYWVETVGDRKSSSKRRFFIYNQRNQDE
jgi:hypothetical protein